MKISPRVHQIVQQKGDGPVTHFMHDLIHDTVIAGAAATAGWLGGVPGIAAGFGGGLVYGAESPNNTWGERRIMGGTIGFFCSTLGLAGPAGVAAAMGIAATRQLMSVIFT